MIGFTLHVSLTDNEIAAVQTGVVTKQNSREYATANEKAIEALRDAVYFQMGPSHDDAAQKLEAL